MRAWGERGRLREGGAVFFFFFSLLASARRPPLRFCCVSEGMGRGLLDHAHVRLACSAHDRPDPRVENGRAWVRVASAGQCKTARKGRRMGWRRRAESTPPAVHPSPSLVRARTSANEGGDGELGGQAGRARGSARTCVCGGREVALPGRRRENSVENALALALAPPPPHSLGCGAFEFASSSRPCADRAGPAHAAQDNCLVTDVPARTHTHTRTRTRARSLRSWCRRHAAPRRRRPPARCGPPPAHPAHPLPRAGGRGAAQPAGRWPGPVLLCPGRL